MGRDREQKALKETVSTNGNQERERKSAKFQVQNERQSVSAKAQRSACPALVIVHKNTTFQLSFVMISENTRIIDAVNTKVL
jgi:hypothetical protein